MKSMPALLLAIAAAPSALAGPGKAPAPAPAPTTSWKDHTISPVANPLYFEDPILRNEIRPIFMAHKIHDDFITGGGDAYLAGAQLRLMLTDKLQFIVNKGGYMWVEPGVGKDFSGWANLVTGFKYGLVDDEASQFVFTPGITYEIPLGEKEIFHGTGDGLINVFASAEKGFGDFHLTGHSGIRIALDGDDDSTILDWNLQADYWTCQYFIPFAAVNGWTVLDEGSAVPINSEGYDAINFGASGADGVTQVALAVGFRSRLTDNLDFGFAFQKSVASPKGLFDHRFTFDVSFRF
jgi:hypothetical protein